MLPFEVHAFRINHHQSPTTRLRGLAIHSSRPLVMINCRRFKQEQIWGCLPMSASFYRPQSRSWFISWIKVVQNTFAYHRNSSCMVQPWTYSLETDTIHAHSSCLLQSPKCPLGIELPQVAPHCMKGFSSWMTRKMRIIYVHGDENMV